MALPKPPLIDDAPPFMGFACAGWPYEGVAVELAQMPVDPGCLLSVAMDGPGAFFAPSAGVGVGPAMLHRSSNAAAPLLGAETAGGALRVVLTLLAELVADSIGRPSAGLSGAAEIGGDMVPPGRVMYGCGCGSVAAGAADPPIMSKKVGLGAPTVGAANDGIEG